MKFTYLKECEKHENNHIVIEKCLDHDHACQ